jgi:PAS domain S-box-containing protein
MNEDARMPDQEPDLFRALVEQSLGLMCVHDLEGNLLFVNAAAAETLGFRPEDGIGWNLRRFLSAPAQGGFDAYLERIRANGVDSGRMSLVSKDGDERIWQYRNVRHDVPGMPSRVLGHAQDVTESVRAAQALKESERRAREALDLAQNLRVESLGVLAGGVAHEFNNLLTVIGGRIQLLLDRLSGDEPACRDLYLIQRSAQRAAELTRELLAFGRRQPLQPRLLDLNEFVVELSLATRVGDRIGVTLRLAEPLRPIHADPGQLKRAIVHLVEHACEAMPAGGQLTVETANADLDEAFVHDHRQQLRRLVHHVGTVPGQIA